MIDFKREISQIISEDVGMDLEEVMQLVEIPQDEKNGDYAFPCFKLAKVMRKAPPMIAAEIAEKIKEQPMFEKVEQVNAYVNMFLAKDVVMKSTINEVLNKGTDFGKTDLGKGKTVIVEFSSPNIAKPFHIGHIRSTVIGNSLYKIHEALGFDVIRINHLGDYGTQFGKMICAYRRWGKKEDVEREPIKTLLSYYTKFHVEAENDSTLEDEARQIFSKLEQGAPEEVALWQWFREESLKEFNKVYEMLGISFDSYNGESFYSDKMPRFLDELREKGLLEKSMGAEVVDLEQYGLGTALITKSDGSSLYITRDIAAAVYRKETYDFYKNIYVVASQQNLHFQQWFKIVELLGYEWAKDCIHVPFGLVSLEEGTMSTRHGRVVFLEDVLNKAVEKTKEVIVSKTGENENSDEIAKKVGIGAVIFQELSANRIKDYVFNWDKVLNFDGETGPYVQYTHARCASVLAKAEKEGRVHFNIDDLDFAKVDSQRAYDLVKLIYRMPEVVVLAGEKLEPSIITRHLVDLAQAFNRFYHDEHILVNDDKERLSKLALVKATKQTLANGLALLGMESPERM